MVVQAIMVSLNWFRGQALGAQPDGIDVPVDISRAGLTVFSKRQGAMSGAGALYSNGAGASIPSIRDGVKQKPWLCNPTAEFAPSSAGHA